MKHGLGDIMEVTILGVFISLALTVFLVIKDIPPTYSMMTGALAGGIVGGVGLEHSIVFMTEGAQMITPAVLRILAAGILAGVLIESGSADVIARNIINKLGKNHGLLAILLSTFLLTTTGIFVLVSILIVTPIALSIAKEANLSRSSILLAMIGGGKAGIIASPSPSAIAASDSFGISLSTVIYTGIIPAIAGLVVTYILVMNLRFKRVGAYHFTETIKNQELPPFNKAIIGPLFVIGTLLAQPLLHINLDPLIILPLGGIVGTLAMGKSREIVRYAKSGIKKMSDIALLLLATGTLAGIISHSEFSSLILNLTDAFNVPPYSIAPLSGMVMSAATGTSTAATLITGSVFASYLANLGVEAIAAAAMVHAGSVAFDHLPHSPFFHGTQLSVNIGFKERLGLVPYETLIGLTIVMVSTLIFGVF